MKAGRLRSTDPPDPRESDKSQESRAPEENAERREPSSDASQEAELSMVQFSATYSGPFPHPAILRQYEAIKPGFTDLVARMAERQQVHQHEMDRARLNAASRSDGRGTYASVITVLGTLGLAAYLIANGHTLTGVAPLVVALGFLVRVLFSGLRSRPREQESESKD